MAELGKKASWRVLFDLSAVLDVLIRREPYFADAAWVCALAEGRQIEGFIAGHSFTTLFYLYRHKGGPQIAYQAIRKLLQVFNVAGVDRGIIEKACDLAWRDFEDALQAVAASGAGCDYLVTRNPKDYAGQAISIIQPAEFLAVWAAREAWVYFKRRSRILFRSSPAAARSSWVR